MIGLTVLIFFVLYGWLSVKAVKAAAAWARRRGRSAKVWGWVTGVVMYSLLFWDFIPTLALHRYYCATRAGYTQYKSWDQWQSENPGVAETLKPITGIPPQREGQRERYLLNQRFVWDIYRIPHWFYLVEREERIVDRETGEVLAKYVDFDTDLLNPIVAGGDKFRDYKFWLKMGSCEGNAFPMPEMFKFNKFLELVRTSAGGK